MAASARLLTSVPLNDRERFAEIAAERGVSMSHLLARLVRTTVAETPMEKVQRLNVAAQEDKAPAEKYTVRLMGIDAARLEERALGRSLTASGYVAHVLRAHLRADPPMPYAEFQELKRVVNELAGIRGVLSQLLNQSRDVPVDASLSQSVFKLLPALKQLREKIQDVLIANSKSWIAPDG